MLHFAWGIYKSLLTTPEYNLLIVGREGAGKSTLLEQLKYMYSHSQEEAGNQSEPDNKEVSASPSGTAATGAVGPQRSHDRSPHHALPPGSPLPATASVMAIRRIRPTVGLNYSIISHRFSPRIIGLFSQQVHRGSSSSSDPASNQEGLQMATCLPPPPADILLNEGAKQQAMLASAPSAAVTKLILRDLGGQKSLRRLWDKYFAQTQAVVYVMDSTLAREGSSSSPTAAAGSPCISPEKLSQIYAEDHALLMELLQHPLLHNVPFLLCSNKADVGSHTSLAALQDALGIADMATNAAFYTAGDESSAGVGQGDGSDVTGLSGSEGVLGGSGFGHQAIRLVEISALDGAGVAGAMDWLVAFLMNHAREVEGD